MQEAFTIAGLLILSQLSPGPDMAYVFRSALARGFRAGMTAGAGICTGFVVHVALVCALGRAVVESPLKTPVVWAAGAWLLYLAWKIFPKKGAVSGQADFEGDKRQALASIYREAFFCNILNPKATLFVAGLAVPVLGAHQDAWYPWALGTVMVASSLAGWCLWSALLQFPPLRRAYLRAMRPVDAVFAVALAVFAVLLCFA